MQVSSLAPECLLYLFYRDAFSLLHKYTYLPGFTVDDDDEGVVVGLSCASTSLRQEEEDEISAHDGSTYCPWCDDEGAPNQVREGCEFYVGRTLRVLDDRLFDFVERMRGRDFEAALPKTTTSEEEEEEGAKAVAHGYLAR